MSEGGRAQKQQQKQKQQQQQSSESRAYQTQKVASSCNRRLRRSSRSSGTLLIMNSRVQRHGLQVPPPKHRSSWQSQQQVM